MIIKSLSRKGGSGNTGQLFNYLFRYMLNEEKGELVPGQLRPLVELAQRHKSDKEFEESLVEQELLLYPEQSLEETAEQNAIANTCGGFGNGYYLSNTAPAQEQGKGPKEARRYVLDPRKPLFDAGKGNARYFEVWQETARQSPRYASLSDIRDKVSEKLQRDGYGGIRTQGQTVLFDPALITELPKDFYRHATEYYAKGTAKSNQQFVVRHNIKSRSVPGFIKEFERNEEQRIHKRKDAVAVYHTILSFSNLDKEHVNEKVLTAMAKKFVELRGKDNIYVFTSHHNTDAIHLHCAMGGSKLSGMAARISKSEFAKIKVELDAYMIEKFPMLVHLLPQHGKAKQLGKSEDEKIKKRDDRSIDRNSLMQVLDELYSRATSQEHLLSELKTLGHIPYYRAGKLTGVKYDGDRKFRLNRLGYDEKKLQELDRQKAQDTKRLNELNDLRSNRAIQREMLQRPVALESRLKEMDKEYQTMEPAENKRATPKEHETENAPLNDKETRALQELRDIRESMDKGRDRNDNRGEAEREPDDTDTVKGRSEGADERDGSDKKAERDADDENEIEEPTR